MAYAFRSQGSSKSNALITKLKGKLSGNNKSI